MTLFADIGNSRIKLIQEDTDFGDEMSFCYNAETLSALVSSVSEKFAVPKRVLVSNVAGRETAAKFRQACIDTWSISPEFLTVRDESCGVRNGYRDIRQLGVDRWLVMIAAWNIYNSDVCVVDCGTAVTADIVTYDGQHVGGYIIPGLDAMNQVLIKNTHQINSTGSSTETVTPGRTTDECIANGALLAIKAFIEAIVNSLNREYGRMFHCIMTGGAANIIRDQLAIESHFEPFLLYRGMKLVSGERR